MNLPFTMLLVVAFVHAEARPSDDVINDPRGLTQGDFARAKMTMKNVTFNDVRDMYRNDKIEGDVGIPPSFLSADGKLRNGLKDRSKRWPNGLIHYEIDSSFDTDARAEIAAAMDGIMEKTCITFEKNNGKHRSYVQINNYGGCWTYVGNVGGVQPLHLGGGCNNRGTITHELMHDIGFWHEQSRNDRDEYINIVWGNIQDGLESQFEKQSLDVTDYLGTKYDYLSVMHYPKWAFSKNGEDTIIPKQSDADIEFKNGLSENDALKINRLYDCDGSKPKPKPNGCKDKSRKCKSIDKNKCNKDVYTRLCQKTCRKC